MMCSNSPTGGQSGGGSAAKSQSRTYSENVQSQSKKQEPQLNKKYSDFLKNSGAEKVNPQNIKKGDELRTRFVNPEGENVMPKWNFYNSVLNEYQGRDVIWSGLVTVTEVKKTSKAVTIIGKTENNTQVKKTFKNDELVFKKKKSK